MRRWRPQFIELDGGKQMVKIEKKWRDRIEKKRSHGSMDNDMTRGVETKKFAIKAFLVSTLLKEHREEFPMHLGGIK